MLSYFLGTFFLSAVASWLAKRTSELLHIVDRPDGERKKQVRPVALLGGVALYVAFWVPILYIIFFNPIFGVEKIASKLLVAFVVSGLLVILGVGDDIRKLSPELRLLVTALAVSLAIAGGFGIEKLTGVSGKALELGLVVGNIASFVWLMGIIFTTKILDGLDGLAGGVGVIAAFVMFMLTMSPRYFQPNVGLVCVIFIAALLGFLLFNFHPARLYLGENGGLFVGFMLGVLAIISGSKVATALLVMAAPVVDFARVLVVRKRRGQPLFQGDREHLHYQLVDRGWSEWRVVLLFYAVAFIFGLAALLLQSLGKMIALVVMIIVFVMVMVLLGRSKAKLINTL